MDDPSNAAENLPAIYSPKGTITGRVTKYEPEMQFIRPPAGAVALFELIEFMKKEINAIVGIDLASLEDRTMVTMCHFNGDHMVIDRVTDFHHAYGGLSPDFVIVDELVADGSTIREDMLNFLSIPPGIAKTDYTFKKRFYERNFECERISDEPMKQNGKSAAYLKHDRSKNCRGRRQWNRKIR